MVAGGYVLCWVVGLLIGGPDLEPDPDVAAITEEFAGSLGLVVFAVLVHGIAAVLLIVLGRFLALGRASDITWVLAVVAASLSFVQLGGEVVLVAVPTALPADSVWEVISRVDGAKMLVLACLIASVHGGRGRVVLTVVSVVAVLALSVSGVGYLFLIPELMAAAVVSLPLLLLWVMVATSASTGPSRPRSVRS
jgi:hypothetical protein